MTDAVTLERVMPASATRVFEMISQPQNMVRWWGHDGMIIPEHDLNFSRPGPWHSVMELPDGTRKMVSGEVTEVDPPRFIAFTWAWHDGGPGGPRGTETRVTIEISEAGDDRANMILSHYGLTTDTARAGHTKGWLSIYDKLEKGLA
ncbi:SRPBCC domain-containing protein [uncultured Litoreibacter sp.]|uniref:SRPBCC family protein n=1 Tax=uncultured Litoreibacter sp. TaxID=1392394 RepID=UPI0026027A3A|nr:SRPBCC domain-containing protein [uncultured Litoreibacter sp.]